MGSDTAMKSLLVADMFCCDDPVLGQHTTTGWGGFEPAILQ